MTLLSKVILKGCEAAPWGTPGVGFPAVEEMHAGRDDEQDREDCERDADPLPSIQTREKRNENDVFHNAESYGLAVADYLHFSSRCLSIHDAKNTIPPDLSNKVVPGFFFLKGSSGLFVLNSFLKGT